MADETQNLDIVISAADSGASAILDDVRLKIAAIDAELKSTMVSGGSFGTTLASSGTTGAVGIAAVGKAAEDTKTPMEDLAGRTGTVARGFEAAGLGAAGAATRIEGLAGAFELLKTAAPEILAIIAAIAALKAGWDFLTEGIGAAAQVQQSMMRLRGIVEETGGSFEAVEPQAEKFIAALSVVGVTAEEGVSSLNKLMEAGASYHDAQSELAVGAQMVAAGIGDWETVTNALTKAQGVAGDMMLTKLVPGIKQMVHDGADLSQVMEYIRQKTADAIASDDSLSGANARLHAEWVALSEIVGQALLPALTYLIKGLIGIVIGFQDVTEAVFLWSKSTVESFESTGQTAESFFTMVGALIKQFIADMKQSASDLNGSVDELSHGNFDGAIQSIAKATGEFDNLHGGAVKATKATTDYAAAWAKLREGMGDIFHPQVAGAEKLDAAMKELAKDAAGVGNLDNDPYSKYPARGKGSGEYNAPAATQEVQQTQLETSALEDQQRVLAALDAQKQKSTAVEDGLSNAMKLTTTSAAEHQAQLALDAQKMNDVSAEISILQTALVGEKSALASDTKAQADARAEYENATTALHQLQEGLQGKTKLTEDDKRSIIDATAAQHNAKSAMEDADKAVKTLTTSIKDHSTQVAALQQKYVELEIAPTAAIDALSRKWNDFTLKEGQSLKEDLDTFAITQQQKYQYYADLVAKLNTLTQQSESDREAAYQKELAAYKAIIQEEFNARQKALQQETSATNTFLDDIIDQHKSLDSALKTVYQNILKSYLDMISKMIVESKLFQSIMGDLGIGKTGPLPAPPVAPSASTAPGQAQAEAAVQQQISAEQTDTAATQALTTATQTNASAVQALTPAINQSTTTIQSQLVPALQQAAAALKGAGGTDGNQFNAMISNNPTAIAQWAGNLSTGTETNPIYVAGSPSTGAGSSSPIYTGNPATSSTDQTYSAPPGGGGLGLAGTGLGGAFAGFGVGTGIADMLGENSTWGGLGGAILGGAGAVFGTILGGPIGGQIGGMLGGAIGGLLGGLFGPHWTPAQQPDVSEPVVGGVDWGQFVANMTGSPGTFNGQVISPQAQYAGRPESQVVFSDLQNLPAMTPALAPLVAQLKADEGGGGPSDGLGIASESNGIVTLGSGKQMSVTAYMQLISSFISDYAAAGGTGAVGQFTVSRTYPNFNLAHVTDENSTTSPTLPPPPPGGSHPPTYPPPSGLGGGAPHNSFDFRGSNFMGTGGIDSIITAIEQALQRSQSGQVPGSVTNSYSGAKKKWPQ